MQGRLSDTRSINAFFALVRAGLWESSVKLLPYGDLDITKVQQLAEEQSVWGLVAAGLALVSDMNVDKEYVHQFVAEAKQLEQHNQAMNYFIGVIVDKMCKAGINTVLVKGQGVAQCYEKPLWRACGDVDFLLSNDYYEKAKEFLIPLASSVDPEEKHNLHQALTIDPWVVELHGKMPTEFSSRINAGIEEVLDAIFSGGEVRSWDNDGVKVLMPSPDNDIIIIFTHFIQHFYIGGVGLRQICDWCRLMYTNKGSIDWNRLWVRLKRMDLVPEWGAFASFAVEYLGMPKDAMPFYRKQKKNSRRAARIRTLVLRTGNFGHNIDESYRLKYPYLVHKSITFWRRLGEFMRRFLIFPTHAPIFFVSYVIRKMKASIGF